MASEKGTKRGVEIREVEMRRGGKEKRDAHERWVNEVWERVVRFANGTRSAKEDARNALSLSHQLGLFPHLEGAEVTHVIAAYLQNRRVLNNKFVKDARLARPAIRAILGWVSRPGENQDRDRQAVETIAEHSSRVRSAIKVLDGRIVNQWREAKQESALLDFVSDFIRNSLEQFAPNLSRLPNPSPVRLCAFARCQQFFARDGKSLYCTRHRGLKGSRSAGENRRYKFQRDNLLRGDRATWIRKLDRKIERLEEKSKASDRDWKLEFLTKTRNEIIRMRTKSGGQLSPKWSANRH